jgi:hypothetical protein
LRSPVKVCAFHEGKHPQLFRVFHVVQKGKHLAELVHGIGRNAFGGVVRVEPLQTLMDEVAYSHLSKCSL